MTTLPAAAYAYVESQVADWARTIENSDLGSLL
jgi:hypothetical protein